MDGKTLFCESYGNYSELLVPLLKLFTISRLITF